MLEFVKTFLSMFGFIILAIVMYLIAANWDLVVALIQYWIRGR